MVPPYGGIQGDAVGCGVVQAMQVLHFGTPLVGDAAGALQYRLAAFAAQLVGKPCQSVRHLEPPSFVRLFSCNHTSAVEQQKPRPDPDRGMFIARVASAAAFGQRLPWVEFHRLGFEQRSGGVVEVFLADDDFGT